MNKDNFYYLLRDRLEYAQDYLIDTSTYIKSVKFQEKVDKELFKDKIFSKLSDLTNNSISFKCFFKSFSFCYCIVGFGAYIIPKCLIKVPGPFPILFR